MFCLKPKGGYGLVGIAFENQAASATSDAVTIFTNVNKWRDSFINKVKSGEQLRNSCEILDFRKSNCEFETILGTILKLRI